MSAALQIFLRSIEGVIKRSQEHVEPELDKKDIPDGTEHRERQDLENGAVLKATIRPGGCDSDTPKEGDLVFVQYTVFDSNDTSLALQSTVPKYGGSGAPFICLLGKGKRLPRGMEVALASMTEGEESRLGIKPQYGYNHKLCSYEAPSGLDLTAPLIAEIQLCKVVRSPQLSVVRDAELIVKHVMREGNGWESPRAPFQVSLLIEAWTLTENGDEDEMFFKADEPMQCQLGRDQLPVGVEMTVHSMIKNENAIMYCPEVLAQQQAAHCILPSAPPVTYTSNVAAPRYLKFNLTLLDFSQVRDVAGDGAVMKSIVRKGNGDFPVDCPLEDGTITLQYKVRGKETSEWSFQSDVLTIETGTGALPEAVDMAVRLMLRNEICLVDSTWERAYGGTRRAHTPPIAQQPQIQFEIELIDFEAPQNWHDMTAHAKLDKAEWWKDGGNTLFKQGRYDLAKGKYMRAMKCVGDARDIESDEQVERAHAIRVAASSNIALCALKLEEYGETLKWCDKTLQADPEHLKCYLRKAAAHAGLGDYEAARADLGEAELLCNEKDPSMKEEVEREVRRLMLKQQSAEKRQRSEFGHFFDRY